MLCVYVIAKENVAVISYFRGCFIGFAQIGLHIWPSLSNFKCSYQMFLFLSMNDFYIRVFPNYSSKCECFTQKVALKVQM